MQKIFPAKLKEGDEVRVIAPARSRVIFTEENKNTASRRFSEMGLKLSFGKHIGEADEFDSSAVESRIEDFHEAFSDPEVKAIFPVTGGFNSNQLLKYIDWDLIRKNPKILCGYSDITILNNAIYAKTGLVSYSGPYYSVFGYDLCFDYTLEYFKKCVFQNKPFEVLPSEKWTDDEGWIDRKNRTLFTNPGWLIINEGEAEGTILGSNLCTFNLLQGTEYFPDLKNSVLFLEDDEELKAHHFDRNLQSLIHLPAFKGVKGLVIGRFQEASQTTGDKLIKIVKSKKELNNIPVIANVDFGHTDPMITFPVGGTVKFKAGEAKAKLEIIEH